jgi:hypothetical protein
MMFTPVLTAGVRPDARGLQNQAFAAVAKYGASINSPQHRMSRRQLRPSSKTGYRFAATRTQSSENAVTICDRLNLNLLYRNASTWRLHKLYVI